MTPSPTRFSEGRGSRAAGASTSAGVVRRLEQRRQRRSAGGQGGLDALIAARSRLLHRALARSGLLGAPSLVLGLDLGVGARPLLLDALELAVERDAVVLARPRDEAVDRGQRDERVLELLIEDVGVLDRRLARDRPADPERHLAVGGAAEHLGDRVRGGRAAGHAIAAGGAERELLRERVERARELRGERRGRRARRLLGHREASPEVVDVHLRVRVDREAHLHLALRDAQREERVPREGARIVDRVGDRAAAVEEAIELVARRLIAPEEDPLAVGPVLVADRGVLVRAMDVDRDAELGEPGDDAARPGERALLHLEAGA